jgi:hypothetical protein
MVARGSGPLGPALFLTLIHRSAWNKNSANFAFWGFYEVRESSGFNFLA